MSAKAVAAVAALRAAQPVLRTLWNYTLTFNQIAGTCQLLWQTSKIIRDSMRAASLCQQPSLTSVAPPHVAHGNPRRLLIPATRHTPSAQKTARLSYGAAAAQGASAAGERSSEEELAAKRAAMNLMVYSAKPYGELGDWQADVSMGDQGRVREHEQHVPGQCWHGPPVPDYCLQA